MKMFQLFSLLVLFGVGFAFKINFNESGANTNVNVQQLPIQKRISNGIGAALSEFPWHAHVISQYKDDNNVDQTVHCGGVILNENWILASADCVSTAQSLRIDIGSVFINQPALSVYPDMSIVHPQYAPSTFKNNLALLRVPASSRLQFPSGPNPNYWPIRLPQLRQQQETFEGFEAFFSGFGYTSPYGQNVSEFLLYSEQKIISNVACLGSYGFDNELISPDVLCGLSKDTRQGPCIGDAGAPLVINEQGSWTLIGTLTFLHSFGSCGRQPVPTAFTRITSHFEWLAKTIDYQFRP